MPTPSNWTLTPGAIRFFVPLFLQRQLASHPLTERLYLNGCGYYPSAQGHHMLRVEHEDNLLLYCTAGTGKLRILKDENHEEHAIHAGDVILIPQGISHQYEADSRNPWTLYWVHFAGTLSESYCRHLGDEARRHVLHAGVSQGLIDAFEKLFIAQNTGYHLPVFVHVCHNLGALLTAVAISSTQWQGHKTSREHFDEVEAHMESVIDGALDLDTLARLAGLSKFHFIKKYKEAYGYAPIQHFIHRKMERACLLLDTTTLTVTAVAESLGYDDPHYFSRLFKKVTGLSPARYRGLQRG